MMSFVTRCIVIAVCGGALAACAADPVGMPMEEPDGPDISEPSDPGPDPNEIIPAADPEGCHAVFAQDLLPTFELTIHPAVWDQLVDDWLNGDEREEMDLEYNPYRPVTEFRYGDIRIHDAVIRLRGNPSYWIEQNKMQFQIAFDKQDKQGHFLGLERLLFDAATYNRSFLRDRLALSFMRDVGLPAPCANNARLMVNGEYYGLFTSLEKIDEVFLARVFPDSPGGDLWKRANWTPKTNLDTVTDERLDELKDATTVEEVEAYFDLAQALRVYAADAIIPNADGPWAGGLNFYLYDDPGRGQFVLLPWDMDGTFHRLEPDVDPYTYIKPERFHGRPWYDIATADPVWFAYYIDTVDDILHNGYAQEKLIPRIQEWAAQIQDAAFTDVNKPFDNDKHLDKVEEIQEFVVERFDYIDQWLVCWQSGGVDDGEGNCVPQ